MIWVTNFFLLRTIKNKTIKKKMKKYVVVIVSRWSEYKVHIRSMHKKGRREKSIARKRNKLLISKSKLVCVFVIK